MNQEIEFLIQECHEARENYHRWLAESQSREERGRAGGWFGEADLAAEQRHQASCRQGIQGSLRHEGYLLWKAHCGF